MEVLTNISDVRSRYIWFDGVPHGRFRDSKTGRFVTWGVVRRALDETLDSAEQVARALAGRLQRGEINLAEYQRTMERQIKSATIAAAALQRGGLQNLTAADYGRIGNLLFNPQGNLEDGTGGTYAYLRAYADLIQKGQRKLDGRFLDVTAGFIRRSRNVYHRFEQQMMIARGFDQAGRLRFPGDSCSEKESKSGRLGCLELGELRVKDIKFGPIREVVQIGDAVCRSNCRCRLIYRNSETGQVWPEE